MKFLLRRVYSQSQTGRYSGNMAAAAADDDDDELSSNIEKLNTEPVYCICVDLWEVAKKTKHKKPTKIVTFKSIVFIKFCKNCVKKTQIIHPKTRNMNKIWMQWHPYRTYVPLFCSLWHATLLLCCKCVCWTTVSTTRRPSDSVQMSHTDPFNPTEP